MMPNTNPVNDNRAVAELMISQAKAHGKIQALAIGAISKPSVASMSFPGKSVIGTSAMILLPGKTSQL